MAEYWKSTARYWCKPCSTYVRDTRVDRRQHEATGTHQRNIQRALNTQVRDSENKRRTEDMARAELERLNRVVGGGNGASSSAAGSRATGRRGGGAAGSSGAVKGKAGSEEEGRRRQMEQLAAMGVQLPEEYRPGMAQAGGWETVRTRVIKEEETAAAPQAESEGVKKEEEDENVKDVKPDPEALNRGVRKRRFGDGDDADQEDGDAVRKIKRVDGRWGNKLNNWRGKGQESVDFDALMSVKTEDDRLATEAGGEDSVKAEEEEQPASTIKQEEDNEMPKLKKEESLEDASNSLLNQAPVAAPKSLFKKKKKMMAVT